MNSHPPGRSLRIVMVPSVWADLSIIWIRSFCTPMAFSRNNVVYALVCVATWLIFWASNARRVASKIFAFSNAFLFTFCGGAMMTVRHGGRSFSSSFDDFRFDFGNDLNNKYQLKNESKKAAVLWLCSSLVWAKKDDYMVTITAMP